MSKKKISDDDRPEDRAELESRQGDYREQYPAYNPDEIHGALGKFRPEGDRNFFSKPHLLDFYKKDLIEGRQMESKLFYRELWAIGMTVVFIIILVVANRLKLG
jgi:hypothetical protein